MTHGVIFDIDDTLLHSMDADDRLYRQAIRDTVGDVRFRDNLSDYEHVSDTGIVTQVLADNGIEVSAATVASIRERFLGALRDHVEHNGAFKEIAGARAVLKRLADSEQFAVGLATGCWRASAELKLQTAGFDVSELPLATADDAMARTSIMQFARNQLPEELTGMTYFGDGIWDQRACASLGWEFRPVGPALNGILSYHEEFTDL